MNTSSIVSFEKEFILRHDFEYDDSIVLKNKYKTICFSNIPESWVIPIDNFLSNIDNIYVNKVSQVYGMLVVDFYHYKFNSIYKDKIDLLNKRIKRLDIDLYNKYGYL